jgi:hypothetical protein
MESFNFNKIEKKQRSEIIKEIENSISLKKEEEYINTRLVELNESGSSENFGIMYSKIIHGFIKPEAKIQRSPMVEPFHLDDTEMYSYIFSSIKKFKETEGWKDKDLNSIIIPVIQHAISSYFGNHRGGSSVEQNNQRLYMNLSDSESNGISIKELKGKNLAVCAEKASTAENFLSFVGINSFLVMGNCRFNENKGELHAFNVLHTSKGYFIYDSTNPCLILENDTHDLKNTLPALYKITEEDFLRLKNGDEVEVIHQDQYVDNDEIVGTRQQQRFYAGDKTKT